MNTNAPAFSVRSFLAASLALAAAAFWTVRTKAPWAWALLALTLLLWLLCLLAPRFYLPVQRFFDWMSERILKSVTWLLLAGVFLLVFVPGRLLLWLRRADPLGRAAKPEADGYWRTMPTGGRKPNFERQY